MKKTYVTTVPNRTGAFLQASRCLAGLGINITRVSYNKAVDEHTLFIDAEGSEEALKQADEALADIGYLTHRKKTANVVLAEFVLDDKPGAVTQVLELIEKYGINISYMSSQADGTGRQHFRMGLLAENGAVPADFVAETRRICELNFIEYNHSEHNYDNSVFYDSFVSGLADTINADEDTRRELMVNANLAMQILDERNLSPYRTFDTIGRFAELLAGCRGEAFQPRITQQPLSDNTQLTLIEPPCGSNTAILRSGGDVLFIDTGYACYEPEMLPIIREILPGFDSMRKRVLITHADLDHCGLLPLFDEIVCSARSAECLLAEWENRPGFREQNPLHAPYIKICKALTGYRPTDPKKVTVPWHREPPQDTPIRQIGFFDFADLSFEVYEGKGGHLPGEIILIDYEHHIAFTGDVYVNLKGMTAEQARYNRCAPVLMTSVDTDPKLCTAQRNAIFERLGAGHWRVFGAHGAGKVYDVSEHQEG